MSNFWKKFFKGLVIFFGIFTLVGLILLSLGLYYLSTQEANKIIEGILTPEIATQLGIELNSSFLTFIIAIFAKTLNISNADKLITNINANAKVVMISITATCSAILAFWLLFTIIYKATHKKVAGLTVSRNKKKQVNELIRAQGIIEEKITSLSK